MRLPRLHGEFEILDFSVTVKTTPALGGAFDSAKNHKRQRRKRQSVTAKRAKSQTPKFV